MWIFTKAGFFSIVNKTGDDFLTVRSRNRADMNRLKKYFPDMPEISEGTGTDYPFRVTVDHDKWAEIMARMSLDIRYNNFKDMIRGVFGAFRAKLYARIWEVMIDLEIYDEGN